VTPAHDNSVPVGKALHQAINKTHFVVNYDKIMKNYKTALNIWYRTIHIRRISLLIEEH